MNRRGCSSLLQKAATQLMFAAIFTALCVLAISSRAAQSPPYLPLNVHVGERAPDFLLPSADGTTVKLSQFAGHNVLLDFYEGYW